MCVFLEISVTGITPSLLLSANALVTADIFLLFKDEQAGLGLSLWKPKENTFSRKTIVLCI